MNKFYVSSGLIKEVVLAGNPIQAAIKAFQRLDGPTLANGTFVISERGFDIEAHEEGEDFYVTLEVVIKTMMLAAEAREEFGNFDNF